MGFVEKITTAFVTYLEGLAWKVAGFLAPFTQQYLDITQSYWLEGIFAFLAISVLILPFMHICKNETDVTISSIRFFAKIGSFFSFSLFIVSALTIGFYTLYEQSRVYIFGLGNFEDWNEILGLVKTYGIIISVLAVSNFIWVKKVVEPKLSERSVKKTKRIGEDDAFTDVRELHNQKGLKPFEPRKYFAKAAKKKSLFFGLDRDRKPLFISRESYNKTNIQVCGSMGSGKGVQAQSILSQQIKQDDAVIVFDPKFDDYLPHILKEACELEGKPFYFFNLRESIPQINPFSDANEHEIAELFIAAFDLETRNTDADVYKISEQKSAQKIASYVVKNNLYISQISEHIDLILSADEQKTSRGLIEKIETLSKLKSVQANSDSTLVEVMKKGGCIYIIGDDVGVTKDAQKMLLVRVLQLVKNIRSNERKFVSIFADEVKSLLCPLLVNQSGQLRSRRANLIFAHQTDADLSVIGENNAEILKGNSTLNWFYRQKSYDSALEVANLTGFKRAQASSYVNETNGLGDEIRSSEARRSTEQKAHLIDTNTIQNLPDNSAVLIGDGLAKIGYCSKMRIDNSSVIPVHSAIKKPIPEPISITSKEEKKVPQTPEPVPNFTPDFLDTLNEK